MTGTDQAEGKQFLGTDAVVQEELVGMLGNWVLEGWRGESWEVGREPE